MRLEKKCLGCEYELPEPFLDLGKTPLANAFIQPDQADSQEPTFLLAVTYCPTCHLVQLTDLVLPEKLFCEYLYFSSYSDSFLAHAREMAESLAKELVIGSHSRVLEIASNDGYLLQYFQKLGIRVLGVEPARNIATEAKRRGIPTLNRFFGRDLVQQVLGEFGKADLIIGNNVLAHVPAIRDFLKAVEECLAPTGVAVFEFPYVRELLEKTEFDTIYHEHVFYFSLSAIKNLAETARLCVFDVSCQPVHGGSLRVYLQHTQSERAVRPSVERMLTEEQLAGLVNSERYVTFGENVTALKNKLVGLLNSLKKEGKQIAAYGAPAKGNTLLNYCGIGKEFLEFTVDRSPHKQGLLLPGTHVQICHPNKISELRPDYVLILPWNLKEEIIEQNSSIREWGGQFIVPIPEVTVL